jgi:hypothetical protein
MRPTGLARPDRVSCGRLRLLKPLREVCGPHPRPSPGRQHLHSAAVVTEPQLNGTEARSTDRRRALHSSAELGSDLLRNSIGRRQETRSSTDHVEAIDAWRVAPDTPALKRRFRPGEQPTQARPTRHDGSSVISRAHQDSQCGGVDAEEDDEQPQTHDRPESALKDVSRPCRETTETT